MNATALKEKPTADSPAPEAARVTPFIDPRNVTLDSGGHVTRNFFVRLPQGFVADDLKETKVWKRVQGGQYAVKRFDRVTLVAYDESWMADAVVDVGTTDSATLVGIRIMQLGARNTPLFEDPNYRVAWFGNGYAVERKMDGQRVTSIVQNAALAEADLRGMYPKTGRVA